MRGWLAVLGVALALGCGGDDDDDTADATAASVDARAVGSDAAGAIDAAGTVDAAAATDAAVDYDATPPDAADACGFLGKPCAGPSDCGAGYECLLSLGGDFCSKARPGCGGFAGATCDDPGAPLCHYLPSADTGPCLSAFELDCICTRSPDSIVGCP